MENFCGGGKLSGNSIKNKVKKYIRFFFFRWWFGVGLISFVVEDKV